MNHSKLIAVMAMVGGLGLTIARPSAAQSPVRRPILSPYLQLLRPQQGPLPNYQNFVEPRLEMERIRTDQYEYQRQFTQQLWQQRQAQAVQGFIASQPRPTGGAGGGTFMNYSHFFPQGSPTFSRRF